MRLVYFHGTTPNFGDDLNAELWPALAPLLFADAEGGNFVGIGTIIGIDVPPGRLGVFSSGAGYDRLTRWAGREVFYHCVRGPVSCRLLGLDPDRAISDGAILTPLVPGFPARATGGGGTVVVPHWQTLAYPGWDAVAKQSGFNLVDPRGTPRQVIAAIAGADLVLTESLHGAILADTYGIPWRAFACSGNVGPTKWVDWCASVGLDFAVTSVPPPDPGPLLAFGRPGAAWGATAVFTPEEAVTALERRVGPAAGPSLAGRVKARLKGIKLLHPLLGLSPSRTAAALAALARLEPANSTAATRERLQGRMMERLRAVA